VEAQTVDDLVDRLRSARKAIPTRSRSSAATFATVARFASPWFVANKSGV
jgi:hypothetical protein